VARPHPPSPVIDPVAYQQGDYAHEAFAKLRMFAYFSRVDRSPDRRVAFGIGEHVCLGAHLARMELQEFFGALVQRLVCGELTGSIDRLHSSFVGGIKRLPVQLELRH
jgi:cytochrome P450